MTDREWRAVETETETENANAVDEYNVYLNEEEGNSVLSVCYIEGNLFFGFSAIDEKLKKKSKLEKSTDPNLVEVDPTHALPACQFRMPLLNNYDSY